MKELENCPEEDIKEAETTYFSETEFRLMLVKLLTRKKL